MGHFPTLHYFVLLIVIVGCLSSCFPDDYDRCGEGFEFKKNDCYKIESDLPFDDKQTDSGVDGDSKQLEGWIGSSCTCEGELCTIAGVPTYYLGTILECDNVPERWPGAVLGCLRTYIGKLTHKTYYARGFCTLFALECEGDDIICNSGNIGDYQRMTSCPEGTVLVVRDYSFSVSALNASMDLKMCVPACERDEDCRTADFDETTESPGEYRCIHGDGVSFCEDARNLTNGYTTEAF